MASIVGGGGEAVGEEESGLVRLSRPDGNVGVGISGRWEGEGFGACGYYFTWGSQ
jgi:hypothetical protein